MRNVFNIKKYPALWLIFSSLALLAVFETLWLRKVWQEQNEQLRQETDYVFHQTVGVLQDTLVRRNMMKNHHPADGVTMGKVLQGWNRADPRVAALPPRAKMQFETKARVIFQSPGDAVELTRRDSVHFNQVQIFVASTGGDSLLPDPDGGVSRLLLNVQDKFQEMGPHDQVFQFGRDTLSVAELRRLYADKLGAEGIELPFRLLQSDSMPMPWPAGGFHTEPIPGGLLVPSFYAAQFDDYLPYLLRKMLPSAAFALLLFGVTTAAFLVVYRSLRQQQRLALLKNELISNITHELKTPITTVGVALEAMSDFDALKNPEKTREYLALSKLELDRLALLVDKVLRLSMFEEQEPRLQAESLDLSALLRQVIAAMTLQAERVGAHIRLEVPETEPVVVHGDRLHLSSVIFNLLDNALKYSGEHPEVVVRLEKTSDTVLLEVQDNGIGIPAEYQPRLFDKFFRVPAGDRHDVKGHGLGLSYVAQVLKQHGGSIRVASVPGEGSTFTVELPEGKH